MDIEEEIAAIVEVFDRIASERVSSDNCYKLSCTTCGGAVSYIERNLDGNTRAKLMAILQNTKSYDIYGFGRWVDYIFIHHRSEYNRMKTERSDEMRQSLNFNEPESIACYLMEARDNFKTRDDNHDSVINQGVELALKTGDPSLIESLILVLGNEANEYPGLVDMAILKSNKYQPMKSVLYNKLREVRADVRDYKGDGSSIPPWYYM